MRRAIAISLLVLAAGASACADKAADAPPETMGAGAWTLRPEPSARTGEAEDATALETKIGQMIMMGLEGEAPTEEDIYYMDELHIGNVALLGRNVSTPDQVKRLTGAIQEHARKANGIGMLIAVDQEGGPVRRLRTGFTYLPAAAEMAALPPAAITELASITGREMMAVGINMDLAPVLDVNDNPDNPVIGVRAFGSIPDQATRGAVAFLQGLQAVGVISTGKHFPGHGSTSSDSHLSLPVVDKSSQQIEATQIGPFAAAIDSGIDAIMTAHVAFPALDSSGVPATLSAPILRLLRQQLGFRGVVITDEIGMGGVRSVATPAEASVLAVQAGADIVLCSRQREFCSSADLEAIHSSLMDAVKSGEIPEARIDESYLRIMRLKAQHGLVE